MKEAKTFRRRLQKFTKIDYWELYKMLFSKRELFSKLAQGLKLP
jgi:DNA helicase-2/ATP-dependent DNA helicase PcrA